MPNINPILERSGREITGNDLRAFQEIDPLGGKTLFLFSHPSAELVGLLAPVMTPVWDVLWCPKLTGGGIIKSSAIIIALLGQAQPVFIDNCQAGASWLT